MLKFLFVNFLVFSLSACAAATHHDQDTPKQSDSWLGKDKLYHFLASGVIGAAATKVAANNHVAPCDAVFIGVSTTLVIGAGKEWYDLSVKKTLFSWKDMFWNLAGSTLGSYAVGECR
jgi:putative lipoprotein